MQRRTSASVLRSSWSGICRTPPESSTRTAHTASGGPSAGRGYRAWDARAAGGGAGPSHSAASVVRKSHSGHERLDLVDLALGGSLGVSCTAGDTGFFGALWSSQFGNSGGKSQKCHWPSVYRRRGGEVVCYPNVCVLKVAQITFASVRFIFATTKSGSRREGVGMTLGCIAV